jgi:signal transduction histidine kinase
LRQRDQPEAAEAGRVGEMASEAISLSRDLARGIFPVQMDGVGLSIALEDLARTTSSQRGMSVSFHETGDTRPENAEDGMHLYRIAQEAVNNAAKHGGARKVTILLSRSEDSLRLAVADDGKGMAPSPEGTRGMGLHSMKYRARAKANAASLKATFVVPSPAAISNTCRSLPSGDIFKFAAEPILR